MSEEKKKELHRVHVMITLPGGTEEWVYRVIVPPESSVDAEMEWRMDWLNGFGTYGIVSDTLIKEI